MNRWHGYVILGGCWRLDGLLIDPHGELLRRHGSASCIWHRWKEPSGCKRPAWVNIVLALDQGSFFRFLVCMCSPFFEVSCHLVSTSVYLLTSHFFPLYINPVLTFCTTVLGFKVGTMAIEKPSDRLFKYPPMERQDLNQSQLGSFKFTPVDNISSLQAIATSYMNNNINAIIARVKAGHYSGRSSHQQAANLDADFFNNHIKPDLGDSRLRLGPAAFRSAVEGATSPTRQQRIQQETLAPVSLFPSDLFFVCSIWLSSCIVH